MQTRPLCRLLAAYVAGVFLNCMDGLWKLIPALLLAALLFAEQYFCRKTVPRNLRGQRTRWRRFWQSGIRQQVKQLYQVRLLQLFALLLIAALGYGVMGAAQTALPQLQGVQEKDTVTVTGWIDDYEIKNEQIYYYVRLKNRYHRALAMVPFSGGTSSAASQNVFNIQQSNIEASIGMQVEVTGELRFYETPTNPGQFDLRLYYKSKNVDFSVRDASLVVIDAHRSAVRDTLRRLQLYLSSILYQIADEEDAGLLAAMLFGEKSGLDDELRALYQRNGIAHVLAISGLHVSLIGMAVYALLRKAGMPLWLSAAAGTVLVAGFGVLSGLSVSALRAVVMYGALMGAQITGRTYDLASALSLAALLVLVRAPYAIFQASMQLSFGAVCALLLFPQDLYAALGKRKGQKLPEAPQDDGFGICRRMQKAAAKRLRGAADSALETIWMSLKLQLTTAPVLAYHFFYLSPYAGVLNLVVIPGMSVLFLFGMLSVCVVSVSGGACMAAGRVLLVPCRCMLAVYKALCTWFERIPGSLLVVGQPRLWRLLLYIALLAAAAIGLARCKKKRRYLLLPLLGMCLLLLPQKHTGLQLTMLDIGQGDCVVLQLADGTTVLSDGGSSSVSQVGTYRIAPYLLSQGIDTLELVLVSHWDADHISGIEELLSQNGTQLTIETLVLPIAAAQEEWQQDASLAGLLAAAADAQVAVRYIEAGQTIVCGETVFTCLSPAAAQSVSDVNGCSAVYRVSYGETHILLTGDLPTEDEQTLLSAETLSAQVLKVAHHGSKNATSEALLARVKPKVALISCSADNTYGHPHEALLARLEEAGAQVFVTSETGAVTLCFDEDGRCTAAFGSLRPFAGMLRE